MPWDRKRLLGYVEVIQLILGVTDKCWYKHIIIIVTWSGVLYHVEWISSYHRITRIVANMKHASTYSPVAFRSVHTGIEPPVLSKIYYAITACASMTQGFTFRKYWLKEKW